MNDTMKTNQPDMALLDELGGAPWKAVDIETTGLVPGGEKGGKGKRGEVATISQAYLDAGWDDTPRARVISADWPTPEGFRTASWDLDTLDTEGKDQVAAAALTGTVVGHNFGFDLYWLQLLTNQWPRRVIDTLLYARALRPEYISELARQCNRYAEPYQVPWRELARKVFVGSAKPWALDTLHAYFAQGGGLDKQWQKPEHWCQPDLPQEALDYAEMDATATRKLILALLDTTADDLVRTVERLIAEDYRGIATIDKQVEDVVAMRLTGMPINPDRARTYARNKQMEAEAAADELVEIAPELEPWLETLKDPNAGDVKQLKEDYAELLEDRLIDVGRTTTGEPKVGEGALQEEGVLAHEEGRPLIDPWVRNRQSKSYGEKAYKYVGYAERHTQVTGQNKGAPRIHAMLGHGPITGRLACKMPNVQQMPSEQAFRDIVEAEPGNLIVAIDYSALDLRVGAALGVRTQHEIRASINRGDWVTEFAAQVESDPQGAEDSRVRTEELEAAARKERQRRNWKESDRLQKEAQRHSLAHRWHQVMAMAREGGEETWSAMRDVFTAGIDAHHATTIRMQGGDPFSEEWLGGYEGANLEQRQEDLKADPAFAKQRKSGKVANLSLLYGMGVYRFQMEGNKAGLFWDWDEATEVRADWLDSYPEIHLYHIWTVLTPAAAKLWVPVSKEKDIPRDMWLSETLGGRVQVADRLTQALNIPDQGSGADIIGKSIRWLHERVPEAAACLVNQVHDELVYEMPEHRADDLAQAARQVMVNAGEHYTMPYGVPMDAGIVSGQTWQKD